MVFNFVLHNLNKAPSVPYIVGEGDWQYASVPELVSRTTTTNSDFVHHKFTITNDTNGLNGEYEVILNSNTTKAIEDDYSPYAGVCLFNNLIADRFTKKTFTCADGTTFDNTGQVYFYGTCEVILKLPQVMSISGVNLWWAYHNYNSNGEYSNTNNRTKKDLRNLPIVTTSTAYPKYTNWSFFISDDGMNWGPIYTNSTAPSGDVYKTTFNFGSIYQSQYIKFTSSEIGRALCEIELLGAPSGGGYKYLGFYSTNVDSWPVLMELLINYTGGSIAFNSTEEIASTTIDVNNAFHYGYNITNYDNNIGELSDMFNTTTDEYTSGERISFSEVGNNRMYFYIELDNPIPDVLDFTYWSGGINGTSTYCFLNLYIYGTNTDPATMGGDGSDMDNLSNWTLLSTNYTLKNYGDAYP